MTMAREPNDCLQLDQTLRRLVEKFGLEKVTQHLRGIQEDDSDSMSVKSSPASTERQNVQSMILDASFDPFFAITMEGTIEIANQAATEAFQYTKQELLGQNISLIVGGGHATSHDSYLKRYKKTGMNRLIGSTREVPARRKDGTEFPVVLGIKRIDRGREGSLLVAYIRDITKQKETEQLQSLQSSILEASFDPFFAITMEGKIEIVNQAAMDAFQYTKEELQGKNISLIVGGGHAGAHDGYLKRYKETGVNRLVGSMREVSARRKDGTEFPVVLGIKKIKGEKRDLLVAYIRDISRQKEAEKLQKEALAEQELRAALLDCSFDSMFAVNLAGVIEKVNAAAVKQFGYDSVEDLCGKNISMIVGGGHASRHDSYLKKYKETGKQKFVGSLREVKALRKDGTEFPCVIGIKRVDRNGRELDGSASNDPLMVAFIRDITQQKEAERLQLALREEELRSSLLDCSFESMVAINLEGVVQMVNRVAVEAFGYTESELRGQKIEHLVSGNVNDEEDYLQRYCDTGELVATRKDGEEFPVAVGIERIELDGREPLLVAFLRDITEEKRATALQVEVRAAEELLCNMLPQEIADRLKNDPQHLADHHDKATILFADIVGFTAMSSNMDPVELVQVLNSLFTRFDSLVDQYGLNKVKTIGDCYMVTSIPSPHDPDSACCAMCHFALDMIDALHDFNGDTAHKLDLRVGINAGPVVAGVVGTSRFLYDLWGDSVNLASRMESTGLPSRVQVTQSVVDAVGEGEFEFEDRGEVLVKGKGMIHTFFLEQRLKSRRSLYTIADQEPAADNLDVPAILLDAARCRGPKKRRASSLYGVLQRVQAGSKDAFNLSTPSLNSAGALSA